MNTQQRRFVEAYLTTAAGNATEAAKTAGYSVKTAHSIGSRLLKHVAVRQELAARAQVIALNADATADKVIKEVSEVAFKQVDITEKSKMKALELLGKYRKLWNDGNTQPQSGVTVNIGYIGLAPEPQPLTINVTPSEPQT